MLYLNQAPSFQRAARIRAVLAMAIFAAAAPASAASANYTFTAVVQPGDTVNGQTIVSTASPVINQNGTIAFFGFVNCGQANPCPEIFKSSSGQTSLVAAPGTTTIAGQPLTGIDTGLFATLKLDDSGNVYFGCYFQSGTIHGICTQSTIVAKAGDIIGGVTLQDVLPAGLSVSGNGQVLFTGYFGQHTLSSGDIARTEGLFTPTALLLKGCEIDLTLHGCDAVNGDAIDGRFLWNFNNNTAIDNNGTIIFDCGFEDNGGGLCSLSHLVLTSGTNVAGYSVDNAGPPAINNNDTVVFQAYFAAGGVTSNGIFTFTSVVAKEGDTIAGINFGEIFAFQGDVYTNDGGTVVFRVSTQSPGGACADMIFTQTDLVLRTGDTLFGQTLGCLLAGGINNSGAIVMSAQYTQQQANAIIVAQPVGAETTVNIEIRGSTGPAMINTKSNGKLPVAILSTTSFDATTVNTSTLTFGHAGTEQSLAFCNATDVNGDGLPDLLCMFSTQATGLLAGDTVATLKGQTTAGAAFTSSAPVVVR